MAAPLINGRRARQMKSLIGIPEIRVQGYKDNRAPARRSIHSPCDLLNVTTPQLQTFRHRGLDRGPGIGKFPITWFNHFLFFQFKKHWRCKLDFLGVLTNVAPAYTQSWNLKSTGFNFGPLALPDSAYKPMLRLSY
ncbi:hypothetical protein AB1N83_013262 [Pleurotus pulmonarius]